jgi:type VI secretion system secreted protein Hcp
MYRNTCHAQVDLKGWGMKALRKHSGTWALAVMSLLLLVVIAGTKGLPGGAASSVALAASPGATSPTLQAVDMFLKIEGIDGEVTATAHKGWIDIQSWSWGVAQTAGAGAGGGAATGRLNGHVTLIKRIDKATPLLFKRCSDGAVLPLVTVELAQGGGGPTYLKYEMNNVMITSITHGDLDGDGIPDEQLTLDFTAVKLTYTQLDASGKPVIQTVAEGLLAPVIP